MSTEQPGLESESWTSNVIRHFRVLTTFLRNATVREYSFRGNFIITLVTRGCWFAMQLLLFDVIFKNVSAINDWSRAEYFGFMATGMLINAILEALFLPNCANFSELIRTGNLDFALTKPVDTQFLVSVEKIDLAMISQVFLAGMLLIYSLIHLEQPPSIVAIVMYLLLVGAAVLFFYSVMISLACLSIFFGRNQGLMDFWFYVTIFARYPASIYSGSPAADILRFTFSYIIPILLVVTVPARVIQGKLLDPSWLSGFTLVIAVSSLLVSRAIFQWSIRHYRSAGS